MTQVKITIDARGLFDPHFKIHPTPFSLANVDPKLQWLKTSTPQSLVFEPGNYAIGVHSCASTLTFTVKDGTVSWDQKFNSCLQLQGQDPQILRVSGLQVTVDATYVGMRGALGVLVGGGSDGRWIERETIRLLPGTSFRVEQGSALVSSFAFSLLETGLFHYEKSYDLSAGGFLEGLDSPTLAFRGYPFLIDATKLGGDFKVGFLNVKGLPTDEHVLFANLLPMSEPFRIEVGIPNHPSTSESGPLGVRILSDPPGQVSLTEGNLYRLEQDTFHGLPRLTIRKK